MVGDCDLPLQLFDATIVQESSSWAARVLCYWLLARAVVHQTLMPLVGFGARCCLVL